MGLDYIKICDSNKFPRRFYFKLRIENITHAGKALEMFCNIKNRVENSDLLKTITSRAVKNGTIHLLLEAKKSFPHQLLIP